MVSASHAPHQADGGFRRRVLRWYREHGRRDLPWRQTRDTYAVLVSEVMLQQTQVDRVVPYYTQWLARWPDAAHLAAAAPGDVIRAWAGLGYNRRALNLHRAMVQVADRREGIVPRDESALRELAGIGPYTAAAVACFAGERHTPVVDTNVGRVIARTTLGAASMKAAGERQTHATAEALLPRRGARDWNLALMDLGAMVCRSRGPDCGGCPVSDHCAWRAAGYPEDPTQRAPAVPFEQTARFARGRIVDALRGREAMDADEIAAILPEAHRDNLADYLRGLERDGLISPIEGALSSWQLPGRPLTGG